MIGIILFTLGALNAVLALTVETCTGGEAGSLYGGFLTLFLYILGAAFIRGRTPSPIAFYFLLPAALVAVWHTTFAIRFAWAYWVRGMSACHVMNGHFDPDQAGEWMDGGEPALVLLWLAVGGIFWIAVVLGLKRSLEQEDAAPDEAERGRPD